MNFNANSQKELLKKVEGLKIKVPIRGLDRKTEHCEQWQIQKLLTALLKKGELNLPFKLIKRERPDFEILNGPLHIGLEVTEIISSDYAKVQTLPEAQKSSSVIDPSLFKWGDKNKKTEQLRNIAKQTELTGPGWTGDSVEREFAKSVCDCIAMKHQKLIKGFQRFTQDYLLIYHNNPTPALDFNKAINYTMDLLRSYWSDNGFDAIYVHKYDNIINFTQEYSKIIDTES